MHVLGTSPQQPEDSMYVSPPRHQMISFCLFSVSFQDNTRKLEKWEKIQTGETHEKPGGDSGANSQIPVLWGTDVLSKGWSKEHSRTP